MSDDKILEKGSITKQVVIYNISFSNKLVICDYLIRIISYSFLIGLCFCAAINTIFTCDLNKKIPLFDLPGNKILFFICTSIALLFYVIKYFVKIHEIFNESESLVTVDDQSKSKDK